MAIRRTRMGALGVAIALVAGMLAPLVVGSAPPAGADQVGDLTAQAAQVTDQIDHLDQQLMALADQSEVARQKLAGAQAAVEQAQRTADRANHDLATSRAHLRDYAVEAFEGTKDASDLDVLLTSGSGDPSVKSGYVKSMTGSSAELIDRLRLARHDAEQSAAALGAAHDSAKTQSDQLASRQAQANAALGQLHAVKANLAGQLAAAVAAEQQRRATAALAAASKAAALASAHPNLGRITTPQPRTPIGGGPRVPAPAPVVPGVGGGAATAVAAALSKRGAPYVWGAAGPDTFDCSGLTMWAWARAGRSLSHYTGSQLAETTPIPISALQPGDLVFVWGPGEHGVPGHVGLYIGGGQMVHAPHTGATVTVNSIYWWSGATIAAGRVR